MCDFESRQLLRVLPCNHEFHAKCVDKWLKVKWWHLKRMTLNFLLLTIVSCRVSPWFGGGRLNWNTASMILTIFSFVYMGGKIPKTQILVVCQGEVISGTSCFLLFFFNSRIKGLHWQSGVKTAFQCRGAGSVPGWRAKVTHAVGCGQKKFFLIVG